MAAPAPTVRLPPSGIPLEDGFPTKITFKRYPAILLWEKTAQPFGVEGGDPVDQTTYHNLVWHTQLPRRLKKATNGKMTVAYDPSVITQIIDCINVNDTITVTHSDGSTWAYFGYMKSFIPKDTAEGSQPEADVEFCPTQIEPGAVGAGANVEVGPLLTAISGT